jgi:hypothetical protein
VPSAASTSTSSADLVPVQPSDQENGWLSAASSTCVRTSLIFIFPPLRASSDRRKATSR